MKLSDYKGEAALDKLAEIIEPLTIMLADPVMQEIAKSGSSSMIKYAKPMLKNHKKEVLEKSKTSFLSSKEKAAVHSVLRQKTQKSAGSLPATLLSNGSVADAAGLFRFYRALFS